MQVLKGADLSCKIKGLIEGLFSSNVFNAGVVQRLEHGYHKPETKVRLLSSAQRN